MKQRKRKNPKAALMAADKKTTEAAEGIIQRPLTLEDDSPRRKGGNSCTEADPQKVSPPQFRRTQASTDLMEILHMKAEADQKAKEKERKERLRPQGEQEQKRREDEERWWLLEEERCRCLEERRRRFEEEQERREVEREKRFLEERKTLKEGREQLRAAALVEAQLRREELELMRLALREATAAEERKDRNLLLKLLSDQIAKT